MESESIWKQEISLSILKEKIKNSMASFLSIEFTKIEKRALYAKMPFSEKTRQPFGILHGGANAVLAESIASIASNYSVEKGFHSVGLELNINHLRPVSSGWVIAKAFPIHLGKKTQVWHIDIFAEESKKQTAVSRLTTAILEKL